MKSKHYDYLFTLMEREINRLENSNKKQQAIINKLKNEVASLNQELREWSGRCEECKKIEF